MSEKLTKVLMIEDSIVDQKAFKRFLDKSDYRYDVSFASSLEEGRRFIDDQIYDVVLVDYELGDGTAFDFLDSCKLFPVIVITGMGDEETAVQAMKRGAYDYLIKDIHSNYLKVMPTIIENAIKRWESMKLQNLLSHTVRCMSDAVFVTDIEGKIIFVNNSFLSTYGYEYKEVLGRSDESLWDSQSDNDESLAFLKHRFNVDWNGQARHIRKSGERFPVKISRSAVKDDFGMTFAFVAIVHDVSEQTLIESHRETLLNDIQEILGRFRKVHASLPVDYDSKSLEDLFHYWRRVVQFLESNSDQISVRKEGKSKK